MKARCFLVSMHKRANAPEHLFNSRQRVICTSTGRHAVAIKHFRHIVAAQTSIPDDQIDDLYTFRSREVTQPKNHRKRTAQETGAGWSHGYADLPPLYADSVHYMEAYEHGQKERRQERS
jgi:hypothetical protein